MSDQQEPATGQAADTGDQQHLEPGDEQIIAQADNPDAVRNALQAMRQRERDALTRAQDLESRVREFEERDMTDQQRLSARAEQAERQAQELTAQLARMRVGHDLGLPAELIDRLRGSTEQELREDAERLAGLVAPARPADFGAGPRGTAGSGEPQDMNALIRRAAGR